MKRLLPYKKLLIAKRSKKETSVISLFNKFNQKPKELPFNSFAEYYIGADVEAKGDCQTDQDIFIDGRFNGKITTSGLVELAKNSMVSADISARTAIFEGHFSGKAVISEELRLTSCAAVKGKLDTMNLIVDKGAVLIADVKMGRN